MAFIIIIVKAIKNPLGFLYQLLYILRIHSTYLRVGIYCKAKCIYSIAIKFFL